jgi:putative inorganic carbon (HCO3(-)) transporter
MPLITRWFLRAGVFVLPLGFAWDTVDQYVLPKLLIARALLLGLLLLFVARAALSGQLTIKRTPLDLPLLAFVVSAAISTAFAANQNVAIFGTYFRFDGLLTLLTYVALFWLSVQMLSGADEARSLLRVLLVSAYPVAAIAILQSVSDSMRTGWIAAAFGTMGNPNVLGAFLAMVFALALSELVEAKEASARVLIVNLLLVVGLALLLSFSRSAWLGAALGGAIVVAAGARQAARRLTVAVGVAAIVAAVLVVAGLAGRSLGVEFQTERDVGYRVLTLVNPDQWGSSRLHIWRDSLALIASRPVTGYGPDNFGLVFPRFATGDWGVTNTGFHQQIDKAHLETLQIAATQGLLGLAAYLWVLFAFARSFWPWRHLQSAVGVFAAFVAYQASIQLNFTSLASALPFWILAAAGMATFGALKPPRVVALPWRVPVLAGSSLVVALLVVLAVPLVIYPYVADAQLRQAIDLASRGRPGEAQAAAELAASFAPQESVYSVELANLAVERHDLIAARAAYLEAARLGTYNAFVYMNLALVDLQLGRREEALSAARKAVELNRFDPATQALVSQIEATSP